MKKKTDHDTNLYLRAGTWYWRHTVNGVETRTSLRTSDRAVARKRRDALMDDAMGIRATGRPCTIGDMLDRYVKEWHRPDNDATRAKNAACMVNILRRAYGGDCARHLPATAINRQAIARAQQSFLNEAPHSNPAARNKAACAFNDTWRKAKSVLTYPEAFDGLNIGLDYKEALAVRRLKAEVNPAFVPFSADEWNAWKARLETLRTEDAPAYRALALMTYCGLRNSEAAHARHSWLYSGRLYIRRDELFAPKRGERVVPVPQFLFDELAAVNADRLCTDGMTARQRSDWSIRHLNAIVKGALTHRDAYDLRKHAGSMVAKAQGLWAAQVFLGHSSITTTQRYYTGLIDPVKPLDREGAAIQ